MDAERDLNETGLDRSKEPRHLRPASLSPKRACRQIWAVSGSNTRTCCSATWPGRRKSDGRALMAGRSSTPEFAERRDGAFPSATARGLRKQHDSYPLVFRQSYTWDAFWRRAQPSTRRCGQIWIAQCNRSILPAEGAASVFGLVRFWAVTLPKCFT